MTPWFRRKSGTIRTSQRFRPVGSGTVEHLENGETRILRGREQVAAPWLRRSCQKGNKSNRAALPLRSGNSGTRPKITVFPACQKWKGRKTPSIAVFLVKVESKSRARSQVPRAAGGGGEGHRSRGGGHQSRGGGTSKRPKFGPHRASFGPVLPNFRRRRPIWPGFGQGMPKWANFGPHLDSIAPNRVFCRLKLAGRCPDV